MSCNIAEYCSCFNVNFIDDTGENSIDQVWFTPEGTVGTVGKFHKLEIGFKLAKEIEREVEKFITKKSERN